MMDTSLLLESSELVLSLNQIAPAKGRFASTSNKSNLPTYQVYGFTLLCTIESETEAPGVPDHGRSGQSPSVRKYLVLESQQICSRITFGTFLRTDPKMHHLQLSSSGYCQMPRQPLKVAIRPERPAESQAATSLFLANQLPGS